MRCFIYRNNKKHDCYLYINKENDFFTIPTSLMVAFGQSIFVMKLLLTSRQKLAAVFVLNIRDRMVNDEYFLQMLTENDFNTESRKTCK